MGTGPCKMLPGPGQELEETAGKDFRCTLLASLLQRHEDARKSKCSVRGQKKVGSGSLAWTDLSEV